MFRLLQDGEIGLVVVFPVAQGNVDRQREQVQNSEELASKLNEGPYHSTISPKPAELIMDYLTLKGKQIKHGCQAVKPLDDVSDRLRMEWINQPD